MRPAATPSLVSTLTRAGALPERWRPVFEAVPREAFVPPSVWRNDGHQVTPVDRATDPAGWRALVDGDRAVTVQADDGRTPPGQIGRWPTSSTTQPSLVAAMLDLLDVRDHASVLEIGTGTGWNAALLCARLGEQNVTTIEIDPALAATARAALATAGHRPTVITGDGAAGWPPGAPYDRIIATCAVRHLPHAWVEQGRPGGRIVAPVSTVYHPGALVALDVADDGTASGRFGTDAAFMPIRAQRTPVGWLADHAHDNVPYDESRTDLHPHHVAGEPHAWFAIGLHLTGIDIATQHHPDGHCDSQCGGQGYDVWFYDPTGTGSAARVTAEPGTTTYPVHQRGPRRLWDEITAAHTWWTNAGRPDRERFGLTVTPTGQHTWLNTPSQTIIELSP
ncbi:MAG TPA: methyltransferase domain-containing protein [Mycobacteriales bacterium]|nr:methyltransferase domain-containing protein [Mycobacteriales bacterium]